MVAAKSTASNKTDTKRAKPAMSAMRDGPDAVNLLKMDHRAVDALLKQYAGAHDKEKQQIAQQICAALTVHAQIEEEILYPAAREALDPDDMDLVNEADVEHDSIKKLIAKVQGSSPADEHYDATVKVIGEYVKHHVKEEESQLFPKLKESELDLKALGAQLAERKEELIPDAASE